MDMIPSRRGFDIFGGRNYDDNEIIDTVYHHNLQDPDSSSTERLPVRI